MRDAVRVAAVRHIIGNREVIEINQQWTGDSGRLHAQSEETVLLPNCGSGEPCPSAAWQVWTKALPPEPGGSRAAVLLINCGNDTRTVTSRLAGLFGLGRCGAGGCAVRDAVSHRDLSRTGVLSAPLAPHASALFVAASSHAAPLGE